MMGEPGYIARRSKNEGGKSNGLIASTSTISQNFLTVITHLLVIIGLLYINGDLRSFIVSSSVSGLQGLWPDWIVNQVHTALARDVRPSWLHRK
jgi:hypothetical protein